MAGGRIAILWSSHIVELIFGVFHEPGPVIFKATGAGWKTGAPSRGNRLAPKEHVEAGDRPVSKRER